MPPGYREQYQRGKFQGIQNAGKMAGSTSLFQKREQGDFPEDGAVFQARSRLKKAEIISSHMSGAGSVLWKPEKIGMMILFPQHVSDHYPGVLYDIPGVFVKGGIPGPTP